MDLLSRISSEVWVQLHYRYKGELFRFNLPLQQGEKFLDGLSLNYSWSTIPEGLRFSLVMNPLSSVELESLEITGALNYGENIKSVFVNGYQSWTGSRERYPGERMAALGWPGRLMSFQRYGDAGFYQYSEKKGRFHGYSYAYVRYDDKLLFAGSLDETAGYTVIGIDTRRNLFSIIKDISGLKLSGRRLMLDLVLMEGKASDVLDAYAGCRRQEPLAARRAFWWSAGRRKAGGGDEVRIRRVLESLRSRKIPVDYFIVDHGWHSSVGDWSKPAAGIPSGMASLAVEIRGSGYKPGLWFAPFVVEMDSAIYRTRKEWLAHDSKNRVRPVGWLREYGGLLYALDLSRADVRDYIAGCVARFRDEWSFEFLRLDLLYAAAFSPVPGKNRGEILRDAVDFLVSIKGNLKYEMSGIPLETAFGKTEYCRIAADTTPYWEHLYKRNIHARERASTINALRSTVGRKHLDGLFFANSVDAFHIGGPGVNMEKPRRLTQLLLHYLMGTLVGGRGDVQQYSEEEQHVLFSLFPLLTPRIDEITEFRRTVLIRYSVAQRSYFSAVNLSERVRNYTLPEGLWFWATAPEQTSRHLEGGGQHTLKPGWSATYMRIEREAADPFAGSDGHIIPGCEIASIISSGENSWTVRPAADALNTFRVWLRVSGNGAVLINGEPAAISVTAEGLKLAEGVVKTLS